MLVSEAACRLCDIPNGVVFPEHLDAAHRRYYASMVLWFQIRGVPHWYAEDFVQEGFRIGCTKHMALERPIAGGAPYNLVRELGGMSFNACRRARRKWTRSVEQHAVAIDEYIGVHLLTDPNSFNGDLPFVATLKFLVDACVNDAANRTLLQRVLEYGLLDGGHNGLYEWLQETWPEYRGVELAALRYRKLRAAAKLHEGYDAFRFPYMIATL